MRSEMDHALDEDDYIGTPAQPDVGGFIKTRTSQEDTGAGLFGALQHVDMTEIEAAKARRGLYLEEEEDDLAALDDDDAKWREGRETLKGSLEDSGKLTRMPYPTNPNPNPNKLAPNSNPDP